jgi:hypothetical protein
VKLWWKKCPKSTSPLTATSGNVAASDNVGASGTAGTANTAASTISVVVDKGNRNMGGCPQTINSKAKSNNILPFALFEAATKDNKLTREAEQNFVRVNKFAIKIMDEVETKNGLPTGTLNVCTHFPEHPHLQKLNHLVCSIVFN